MRAGGLQLLRRDARGLRRRIERPAEMLSRMAHTDARAVVHQHLLVERDHQIMLLGERGRGALLAGREIMREIAGKPWASLRAAPDHHGVRTGRVSAATAASKLVTSPLTTTGMDTARFTARTAAQSADPL